LTIKISTVVDERNKPAKPKGLFLFAIMLVFLGLVIGVVSAEGLNDWTQHTSSFGINNVNSIATDGSTWVAVGNSGKLATATDPTGTWTQRVSSFSTTPIYKIATDGTTWVAVGSDGKLATATDPTGTWTQRTSSFDTSTIFNIATDGTTWVAVGGGGKLATATDPTGTWTQRTSSFDTSTIYGIATDGTTWVAVGSDGKLATATDPTGTWTQRTSSFNITLIYRIATDGTTWVAVGSDGKLATATDPTGTWTQRTSSFNTTLIRRIATDDTTWVAVGSDGKLATATDPTGTWTQRVSSFSTTNIRGLATDGSTWVAVGDDGKLAYYINEKPIITNPTAPIYPTVSYDWNAGYIDSDYNSDYTYEYSFGFNDVGSFDGDEIFADTNQTLDYDQNTIKYFDLDYTPTSSQIGDINYSFFIVYRYLDSVYDSNQTAWSSDTFTVADNIVFDFNAPAYPDWANVFYPTKSYSGLAHYEDKSYQSGVTSYKFDLGSNDTNAMDGNEEYWKQNIDINSIDGNVNAYFEHTISVDDKGKTLYAFLTMKRYYSDVFIDSNTEWTSNFDVNYGKLRVQFYDENCATTLDGNVVWYNDMTIPVDENGLAQEWLEDHLTTDGEDMQTSAYREVDGIVTHTERSFDYYFYLTKSYDLNYTLLPVDMGTNIEFMAKDKLGNIWANKYLLFSKGTDDICPYSQELYDTYTQNTATSDSRGVRFSIEKEGYINSFNIQQQINYFDSWALYNYTMSVLLDSGTGINATTTNVETSRAIKLDLAYEYSLVLYNEDGSNGRYMYSKDLLKINPVVTEYISYNFGCKDGGIVCTDDDAYAITGINIMDAVNYEAFFSNPIVEVTKTDSEGKATFYLLQDGNYTAVIIDGTGTITDEYYKTTINVKKPKNEKTLALISPYDVDVGGLLEYSLTNQSASSVPINVFAGTVNYYQFSVVDYTLDPADQVYITRNYSVRAPMGIEYSSILEIQPYLLSKEDGVIPKIYVLDQLRQSVPNALLLVIKNIDGVDVIVESLSTISTGSASISFYPLDYYTIQVWYDDILKATYLEQLRESTDIRYYTIDLYTDSIMDSLIHLDYDLSGMKSTFNPNDSNSFDVKGEFVLNAGTIDNYDISIKQDGSSVYNYTLGYGSSDLSIDQTVDIGSIIDTDYKDFDVEIKIDYSYSGNEYERTFTKKIVITKSSYSLVSLLKTVPSSMGRIWAVLLALILTGFAVFGLANVIGMEPLIITTVSILILSIFAFLGWFETGVVLFGADVGTSTFVLMCIGVFYFMFKR